MLPDLLIEYRTLNRRLCDLLGVDCPEFSDEAVLSCILMDEIRRKKDSIGRLEQIWDTP